MEAKNKDDPKGRVWSVTFWLAEAAKPSTCRLAGTSQSRAAMSGGALAHTEPAHACIQLTGVYMSSEGQPCYQECLSSSTAIPFSSPHY